MADSAGKAMVDSACEIGSYSVPVPASHSFTDFRPMSGGAIPETLFQTAVLHRSVNTIACRKFAIPAKDTAATSVSQNKSRMVKRNTSDCPLLLNHTTCCQVWRLPRGDFESDNSRQEQRKKEQS